jgi:hypothetical protein
LRESLPVYLTVVLPSLPRPSLVPPCHHILSKPTNLHEQHLHHTTRHLHPKPLYITLHYREKRTQKPNHHTPFPLIKVGSHSIRSLRLAITSYQHSLS